MIPYLILLGVVSGSGVLFFWKDKKIKMFLIFTAICTILMQSLRAPTVGIDTPTYYNGFQIIRSLDWANCNIYNWEVFYTGINWVIGQFTDNFNLVLLVVALIVIPNIWYFVYKNSDNVFWSIFLFFTLDYFFMCMYSVRQYCAIAIGINIFTVLRNDSSKSGYLKSAILLIIAMCFHTTAFVCVAFFVPFLLKKIDTKTIAFLALGIVVAILLFSNIVDLLFEIFPRYAKYEIMGSEKFQGMQIRDIDLLFTLIKVMIFLIVSRFNPNKSKNQILYKLLFIVGISVGLSIMVTQITLMMRFTYYFDIFLIVLIPNVIERFKKYRSLLYLCLMTFGVSYFIYVMSINGGRCVPYNFFWQ